MHRGNLVSKPAAGEPAVSGWEEWLKTKYIDNNTVFAVPLEDDDVVVTGGAVGSGGGAVANSRNAF